VSALFDEIVWRFRKERVNNKNQKRKEILHDDEGFE
jgi:hypothetical protein